MKRYLVTVATLCLTMHTGCATVLSGTTQSLAVNSEPSGARVYMDNEFMGETPVEFEVKRKLADRRLVLKKEGHPDTHKNLESRFNPVALVNFMDGLGWVVDAFSGAIGKYDSKVDVQLEKASPKVTVDPSPGRK